MWSITAGVAHSASPFSTTTSAAAAAPLANPITSPSTPLSVYLNISQRSPTSPRSGAICKASQAVDLFSPPLYPEIVVREARLEDCWEVAETHCSSFFPGYSFPLDLALRIDRLVGLLSTFSLPDGCSRTCLVAVVEDNANPKFFFENQAGGLHGSLAFLNKGYVAGILTIDTVADFLPRKGPLRQRSFQVPAFSFSCHHHHHQASLISSDYNLLFRPKRQLLMTGIAYVSNVAVRERDRCKGIAKKLVMKAEAQARSWGCRAIALHCDVNNPAATRLYKGQGFKSIKVPEKANWPQPKTSPNVQFCFMMKLLTSHTAS